MDTPISTPTDTATCVEQLRSALAEHGIKLPSLGLDWLTPDHLIALGNCNLATAHAFAEALSKTKKDISA
ncbi:hypothetical protein [Streptomyces apocyni]|uniref:hypothetical protein n=1 Tax=Streptomyces apocyni TaxID=2654677 RepID=UPI0012EA4C97|nr:hypothetical protein [Streptomyces apocyni]